MAKANSNEHALIPAVGYLRRSSDKQEASLPQQREALERYAKEHGYKIIRWYIDDAISGDATEKRFEFQRMIKDAENVADFKAVLCWDQDRFGRFDSIEAGRWIHPLREAGVYLDTIAQGKINWNDFAGRMMYGIVQEGKHQYLRDLSRNATRGLIAKASRGEWPAGRPPLGLTTDKAGRLIFGPQTDMELVQRIFRDYQGGMSLQSLVDTLNREGLTTSQGGKWYRSTLHGILTNALYAGDFVWNTRCQSKYNGIRNGEVTSEFKRGKTNKSEWISIQDNHPAIVTRKLFNAVQRRLSSRSNRKGEVGVNSLRPDKFAFTGLLHCGKCGSRMYGHTVSGKHYFVCGGYLNKGKSFCDRNAVKQDELLEHILTAIETNCASFTERLRSELRNQISQAASKVSSKELADKLATVESKLKKAKQRLVEVDLDIMPVVQDQVRSLIQEQDTLQAALKAASIPIATQLADVNAKTAAKMKLYTGLRKTLTADVTRRGEFLRKVISKVELRIAKEPHGKRNRFILQGGSIYMQPMREPFNTPDSPGRAASLQNWRTATNLSVGARTPRARA